MNKFISRRLLNISGGITGLLILLCILVAVNVIFKNLSYRMDFTEEKLFTLSKGTINILKNIDGIITLKLFFSRSSRDVPVYLKDHANRVEDLLREYKMASGGKIVIETYDPKPDSDEEEWAMRYGVNGQQIQMFGTPVYFGLVASAGNNEAVLPFLDPRREELLEYNITRMIYRIIHPEKPVIGIISSLPVFGNKGAPYAMPGQPPPQSSPPWIAFQNLKDDYEIRQISDTAEEIEKDITALIAVHPKGLSDKTLYAIDQFVLRGGHVLAFLDSTSIAEIALTPRNQLNMERPTHSSTLGKLLPAWGVGFDPNSVLVDPKASSRLRASNNSTEDSPVWLSLRGQAMNRNDILTTKLEFLMLVLSGAFTDDDKSDEIIFTPLITASDSAGTIDRMMAQLGGFDITGRMIKPVTPLYIAARLSGKFKTAFPQGKPENDKTGDKENKNKTADAGLKEGTSSVILVADVDMVYDRFCVSENNLFGTKVYQQINDNINFFDNAVEQITGSSDLIGIRSRGKFERPFDRVLALEQQARSTWQSKEEDLQIKLRDTQQKMKELQAQKDNTQRFILSLQQKETIDGFRKEEGKIREELKEVRKNLRKDIEQLGVKVKAINIVLIPALISLTGVCFGIYRKKRK